MRIKTLIAAMCMIPMVGMAQNDPVVMTINNEPVLRSEFEYSFNKNNADGVIDKKTVNEYVDLFVNYKLKVVAALDASLDTLSSFKAEYTQYRDQQIRPTLITDVDVEREARSIYENTKQSIGPRGLIKPAHILIYLKQRNAPEEDVAAKMRIDSIYAALKAGADFAEMARTLSQDQGSAENGGELPWITPNQTFEEFENVAYSLQPGEMSEPFLSPVGYHIILMKERKQLDPYEEMRADIMQFIDKRNLREKIINDKITVLVKSSDELQTKEQLMQQRADSLANADMEMKYLFREYYDGLLLFEISNSTVWENAAKDEAGLEKFFKKNKKKYQWDQPRFKGMAYHVKVQDDVEAVRKSVEGVPFDEWAEVLRTTFNSDSVLRIRVEKGLFKQGDNGLIDTREFNVEAEITPVKDFPIDATFGKMLKTPEEYNDVRGLVVADYQEYLEKNWVKELRKRYKVVVNKDVLKTVNNH